MLVNKDNLLESLKVCAKIAHSKTVLPILKCVGLHFFDDKLCVYASNLTSGVGCEFILPSQVEEETLISVDASLLLNVLSNICLDTVDIKINTKNNRISITCEDDAYTIPFLPEPLPTYEMYKALPQPRMEPSGNFAHFFTQVQKASNLIKHAPFNDSSDPLSRAVYLDYLSPCNWAIAATDKATLYRAQMGDTANAALANIHRQDIAILKTLAAGANQAGIELLKEKTVFAFSTHKGLSIRFFTQNVEMKRPDIEGVISVNMKNEIACKIYVKNNVLAEALAKVSPVAETLNSLDVKTIAILVEGSQLSLIAHNTELGAWARTDVFADVQKNSSEGNYTIGVNSRFLQKITRERFFELEDETWEMFFSAPALPIIIRPNKSAMGGVTNRDALDTIYLIMPVMLLQEIPKTIDELEKVSEQIFV